MKTRHLRVFGLLLFLFPTLVGAQNKIHGSIQNEKGNAIVGALIKSQNQAVYSQLNGEYQLNLADGAHEITVNYLGYKSVSKKVTLDGADVELNFILAKEAFVSDEVIVSSSRVQKDAPVTVSNYSEEDIEKVYQGQDGAFLIEQLSPSVVAYSQSGTNLSNYGDFRLRGMDQSRINITLNGVPLNDMIDQGVFFSNFTDFGNSIESIQIQRGVGTSSNGVSSYAGSINFESLKLTDTTMHAEVQLTGGSFNTKRMSAEFNTGKMENNFALYGRFSNTQSDGYRNHTSTASWSAFLSAAYFIKNHTFKFTGFNGKSKNGLAYTAVAREDINNDPKTNNNSPNDIDDFGQWMAQLQHIYQITSQHSLLTTLYYAGAGGDFPFGFDANGTFTQINYPLYNDHIGAYSNFNGQLKKHDLKYNFGISASNFERVNEQQMVPNYANPFKREESSKNEAAAFAKATYRWKGLEVLTDVQVRGVELDLRADQNQFPNASIPTREWLFVNPKVGVAYQFTPTIQSYASFGRTGRAPTRGDILGGTEISSDNLELVQNINNTKAEMVNDAELGVRWNSKNFKVQLNAFYMQFENEIAPVGTIENAFVEIRRNLEESFRRGFESEFNWQIIPKLSLSGSWAYMQALIKEYPDLDNNRVFRNVTTPLSPEWNLHNALSFEIIDDLLLTVRGRYLSKSFIEPTNKSNFVIPDFWVMDTHLSYAYKKMHHISIQWNNVFDKVYFTHGLVINDTTPGFFVQAPMHLYATYKIKF